MLPWGALFFKTAQTSYSAKSSWSQLTMYPFFKMRCVTEEHYSCLSDDAVQVVDLWALSGTEKLYLAISDITLHWPLHNRITLLFIYQQIHNEVLRFVYKLLFFDLILDLSELFQSSSQQQYWRIWQEYMRCSYEFDNTLKSQSWHEARSLACEEKAHRLWKALNRRSSTIWLVLNWNLWLTMR